MNWKTRLQIYLSARRGREAGNAIAMVFMAIGMAGVVVYGLNNIMRGPAMTAAETGRRTIAENNLVATTRLAITAAARQQSNGGDCDQDGFVEPVPFRAVTAPTPFPVGGGLLPMTVGASLSDPWGTQYGYCVWDPGTVRKSDAFAGCGGAGANRLNGAKRDDQPAIAVISAGKNGAFETSCNAFVDTTPADEKPDTPLVNKPAGSDDIVLSYTYAEANGIGGGLWKISQDPTKPNTAEIGMNIKSSSAQGASFDGKVELKNKGLVLPGDPGDDSVTGACDAAKDGQLRRNTSTSPPTIEMCDSAGSSAWVQVSGSSAPPDPSCYFGGYSSVWAGAGPNSMVLSDSGNHIYGTGLYNDLFATMTTADPANPTTNTIYGSNGGDFDDAFALATSGNYAYVPSGSNRLTVVNVSNPASPTVAGFVSNAWLSGSPGVAVSGNYVYVTGSNSDRLNIIDVSAPASPVIVGSVTDTWLNGANGVAISGNYAYVASYDAGALAIVDITAPASPVVYSHLNLSSSVNTIAVKGNYAYVGAYNNQEIYVVDISDPANPALVTTFNNAKFQQITEIRAVGRYLFISAASYFDTPNAGLVIVDVGTPATPTIVGSVQFDSASSTIIKGRYAYVSGLWLEVFDIGCDPLVGGGTPPSSISTPGGVKVTPDPLDVGLVSYWKFDEAPTTDGLHLPKAVGDSVGDNDGDRSGAYAAVITGQKGNALEFGDGANDSVVVPGHLGEPEQATVAGWVNLTNHKSNAGEPNVAHIFSIGDYMVLGSYYSDQDITYPSGVFIAYYDGSLWQIIPTNRQIAGTGWHYIVGTFDAVNDMFRVYIDGQKLGESTSATDIAWTGLGDDTHFGEHGDGDPNYSFSGALDELRFYNRALSPSEVAALTKRESVNAIAPPSLKQLISANANDGKIAAGENTTCAIKKDGTLWCWGGDVNQQLGNGALQADQPLPVQVVEPRTQTYYISGTASDMIVGGAAFVSRMLPSQESALTNTGAFSAGQTISGYVVSMAGFPGVDDGTGLQNYSTTIRTAAPQACIKVGVSLQRVTSGGVVAANVALDKAKNLSTTATTFTGRADLGVFATTDRLRAQYTMTETCGGAVAAFDIWGEVEAPILWHSPWTSVTVSETHACGVKADGSGYCWGLDQSGGMGNSAFSTGALFPAPHRISDGWVRLYAGADNTCGLQRDGTALCAGLDTYGQIGNGATTGQMDMPSAVTTTNWRSLSVSDQFTCGVDGNGAGYCWGRDNLGKLGNGAIAGNKTSPYEIAEPGPWVKITTGASHACGLKADSSIWCWGYNTAAQLGVVKTTDSLESPTMISKPYGWVDVVAGPYFTCAINVDSKVYCWGDNGEGRLGNNDITLNIYEPWPVNGSEDTAAIALGYHHACAMKNNGAVLCWGEDNKGQIGNGPGLTGIQSEPNVVQGFPGTANWTWNDANTIIMAPYNTNIGLNGGNLSDATSVPGYFGFSSPGRALMRQEQDSTQAQILAGTTGSPALTFNTTGGQVTFYTKIANWGFEETTGTTAASTPAGFTATLNNGVTHEVRGVPVYNAYGLTFDGVNDYAEIANNASLRPTSIGITMWVNPAATQSTGAKILSKAYSSDQINNSYSLGMGNDGVLNFSVSNGGILYGIQGYVQPNSWSYVTAVYDPAGSAPQQRLYINGVRVATRNIASAIGYDTTASGVLSLGRRADNTGYYKGSIDELTLYARGFNDAEALNLYYSALYPDPHQMARSMGIDYTTNMFKIAKNGGGFEMDTLASEISITAGGNLGIAVTTAGGAASKLEVNGGLRVGTDLQCDVNRAGSIRYTGGTPAWQYCNGTSWTAFTGAPTPWKADRTKILGVGSESACAIKTDGSAWCWGIGRYLGINDSTTTLYTTPQRVHDNASSTGWNDWTMISSNLAWDNFGTATSANMGFSIGLRANGTLWGWGANQRGELGDNTTTARPRPVQVRDSAGTGYWSDWIFVTTGWWRGAGIRTNGTAWCWGEGNCGTGSAASSRPKQIKDSAGTGYWSDWVNLSMSYAEDYGCGVRVNGTGWCWGVNGSSSNRLGNTSIALGGTASYPVQVMDSAGTGYWTDWVNIKVSGETTCGLRSNGTIWCWGEGSGGELGNNGTTDSNLPVQVRDSAGTGYWTDWTQFDSLGWDAWCAIRAGGTLWCWGDVAYGFTGAAGNVLRPTQIMGTSATSTCTAAYSDWISIGGEGRSCGVRAGGNLYCWGDSNGNGGDPIAIGNGTSGTNFNCPQPVL